MLCLTVSVYLAMTDMACSMAVHAAVRIQVQWLSREGFSSVNAGAQYSLCFDDPMNSCVRYYHWEKMREEDIFDILITSY